MNRILNHKLPRELEELFPVIPKTQRDILTLLVHRPFSSAEEIAKHAQRPLQSVQSSLNALVKKLSKRGFDLISYETQERMPLFKGSLVEVPVHRYFVESQEELEGLSSNPIPADVDKVCSRMGYKRLANVVWLYPNIRTHELRDCGVFSNNYHNISKELERPLNKVGYAIVKTPVDGAGKSWAWAIEEV